VRYEGMVYRPPSEAGSLLIQATVGCPHNKCRFCGMYKNKRFKIRPVKDILEDLDQAAACYGTSVRTLFLPDGNTIIMKTPSLVKILEHAGRLFPKLKRVTSYGSARFIIKKSDEELKELREAGLRRIHMGLESGDDETLSFMHKGATADESIEAGQKIRRAGMELSVYYLVGIGGRNRLREHALESARAINEMQPNFIRLRTYYPVKAAPVFEDIMSGRFELPDSNEALEELRLLISNLKGPSMLLSDHVSNYINLSGRVPDDTADMMDEISTYLSQGRPPLERYLASL
jgi:radical SAM superfamily enzyme YgiQ (UPF0313 family)